MQLVLKKEEFEKMVELLDDGKQRSRDIEDPHRTTLEKVMMIKNQLDSGKAWAAAIVAVEEE